MSLSHTGRKSNLRRSLYNHRASLRSDPSFGKAYAPQAQALPSSTHIHLLNTAMKPVPPPSTDVQDHGLQHLNPVASAVHRDMLSLNRGGFSDLRVLCRPPSSVESSDSTPSQTPTTSSAAAAHHCSPLTLEHDILAPVMGVCDKIVGRVSAFETTLQDYMVAQTRANAYFLGEVNVKLIETQAAIAKQLQEHTYDHVRKRNETMENVDAKLDSWYRQMMKYSVMEGVEGALKNVKLKIDEKNLLEHTCAVRKLATTLEGKTTEQYSAMELAVKEVQSASLSMQSQFRSLNARMKSIDDKLSAPISNLADSALSTALSTSSSVTSSSTSCNSTSATVLPSPTLSAIFADSPVSFVTPELLATSLASLQENYTDRISQAEEMLVQLAKTMNVARDETYSGIENLAGMLEKSHELQAAQMEIVQIDVRSLKVAMGIINANPELTDTGDLDVSPSLTASSVSQPADAFQETQRSMLDNSENSMTCGQDLHCELLAPTQRANAHIETNEVGYATDASTIAMDLDLAESITPNESEGNAKVAELLEKSDHMGAFTMGAQGGTETEQDESTKPQHLGDWSDRSPAAGCFELPASPCDSLILDSPRRSPVPPSLSVASSSSIPSTASENTSVSRPVSRTSSEREIEFVAPTAQDSGLTVSTWSAGAENESNPQAAPSDEPVYFPTAEEPLGSSRNRSRELGHSDTSLAASPSSGHAGDVHVLRKDTSDCATRSPRLLSPEALTSRDIIPAESAEVSPPKYSISVPSSSRTNINNEVTVHEYGSSGDTNKRKRHKRNGPRTSRQIEKQHMERDGKDTSDVRPTKKQKLSEPSATNLGPDRKETVAFPCCDGQFKSSNPLTLPSHGQSSSEAAERPASPCKSASKSEVDTNGDWIKPKILKRSRHRRRPIASTGSGPSSGSAAYKVPTSETPSFSSTNHLSSDTVPERRTPMMVMPRLAMPNCDWPKKYNEDEDFDRQLIRCRKCLNDYHYRCIGISKGHPITANARSLKNYLCPPCCSLAAKDFGAQMLESHPLCGRPDCDWPTSKKWHPVSKFFGRAVEEGGLTLQFCWLVKWPGYPKSKWRWELATEIGDAGNLIQDFYAAADKDGLDIYSSEPLILKQAMDDGYKLTECRGRIYG